VAAFLGEHRGLAVGSLAACATASSFACFVFAVSCTAEDVAFALLPALSALFAGLATGVRVVTGSRRRKILGTLASVFVAIVWGFLTLLVSAKAWMDACYLF
jgi:hypothetical protein